MQCFLAFAGEQAAATEERALDQSAKISKNKFAEGLDAVLGLRIPWANVDALWRHLLASYPAEPPTAVKPGSGEQPALTESALMSQTKLKAKKKKSPHAPVMVRHPITPLQLSRGPSRSSSRGPSVVATPSLLTPSLLTPTSHRPDSAPRLLGQTSGFASDGQWVSSPHEVASLDLQFGRTGLELPRLGSGTLLTRPHTSPPVLGGSPHTAAAAAVVTRPRSTFGEPPLEGNRFDYGLPPPKEGNPFKSTRSLRGPNRDKEASSDAAGSERTLGSTFGGPLDPADRFAYASAGHVRSKAPLKKSSCLGFRQFCAAFGGPSRHGAPFGRQAASAPGTSAGAPVEASLPGSALFLDGGKGVGASVGGDGGQREALLERITDAIDRDRLLLHEAFHVFDSNGDGVVSLGEFVKTVQRIKPPVKVLADKKREVTALFTAIDTTGSRGIDLIEFLEFFVRVYENRLVPLEASKSTLLARAGEIGRLLEAAREQLQKFRRAEAKFKAFSMKSKNSGSGRLRAAAARASQVASEAVSAHEQDLAAAKQSIHETNGLIEWTSLVAASASELILRDRHVRKQKADLKLARAFVGKSRAGIADLETNMESQVTEAHTLEGRARILLKNRAYKHKALGESFHHAKDHASVSAKVVARRKKLLAKVAGQDAAKEAHPNDLNSSLTESLTVLARDAFELARTQRAERGDSPDSTLHEIPSPFLHLIKRSGLGKHSVGHAKASKASGSPCRPASPSGPGSAHSGEGLFLTLLAQRFAAEAEANTSPNRPPTGVDLPFEPMSPANRVLERLWPELDLDGDGRLTKDELSDITRNYPVLRSAFNDAVGLEEGAPWEEVFARLDLDRDGSVDKSELELFLQRRHLFATIDKNKDGSLTRAEIAMAMVRDPLLREKLHQVCGFPDVKVSWEDGHTAEKAVRRFSRIFRAMDLGKNDEIEFPEFIEFINRRVEVQANRRAKRNSALTDEMRMLAAHAQALELKKQELTEIFAAVDRNNDGRVSKFEMLKALNRRPELRERLRDLLGIPSQVTSRACKKCFETVFECMDQDKSGEVDLNEMMHFLVEMDHMVAMQHDMNLPLSVQELLDAADKNRDGQLSQIEIINALHKQPELRVALETRKEQMALLREEFSVDDFEDLSVIPEGTSRFDQQSQATSGDNQTVQSDVQSDVQSGEWNLEAKAARMTKRLAKKEAIRKRLQEVENSVDELFQVLDENKDGFITRIEFRKKLSAKGGDGDYIRSSLKSLIGITESSDRRSHLIFEEFFDGCDLDSTGDISKVEFKNLCLDMEFIALHLDDPPPGPVEGALLQLDKDKSGGLSKSELIRALKESPEIRKFVKERNGHVEQAISKAKTSADSTWVGDDPL